MAGLVKPLISSNGFRLNGRQNQVIVIIAAMSANEQGIHPERFQLIPRVLVFITHRSDVLLIKGAPTKRIWANKYNGVGGHVERGEDVLMAARREIVEETGLEVSDLRFRGVITIDAGQPIGIGMFVFTALATQRETIASAEGALEWISLNEVFSHDLVEDLPVLLPKVLAMGANDSPFFGHYWYDEAGRLQTKFS